MEIPEAGPSRVTTRSTRTKVEIPRSEAGWSEFLNRYATGELVTFNFPLQKETSSSSLDNRKPPSDAKAEGDSSDAYGDSGPEKFQPQRRHSLAMEPAGYSSEDKPNPQSSDSEAHPDVSSSGAVNQDPDIPNIPDGDLPPTSAAPEPERKGPGKDDLTGNNLTGNNVNRMDRSQKEEHSNKGSRLGSSVGKTFRRRRKMHADHAELASLKNSASQGSSPEEDATPAAPAVRRQRPPYTRSRGSLTSSHSVLREGKEISVDEALITRSDRSVSSLSIEFDPTDEPARVRQFYEANGYMPAPRQPADVVRRRLRVIRRLGLENPDQLLRDSLDRFTRLAVSIFGTKMALVSIVAKDRQLFLSEIGFDRDWTHLDVAFCCHTIMGTGNQCLIVPDAAKDWRFRSNPLVDNGKGAIQFYAGAPLKVGSGSKSTIIGSLCVIDAKPREFGERDKALLQDLADCVVSELELLYSRQSSIETAKLHQISVDFLRRSLKNRPKERAGKSRQSQSQTTSSSATASNDSSSGKRRSGKDGDVSEDDVDIYDEACREIRVGLNAYAVAIVDLRQFHLFYPAYQSSSAAGTSTRGSSSANRTVTASRTQNSQSIGTGSVDGQSNQGSLGEESEAYARSSNIKRARQTYAVTDSTMPSRTPQVLFIPTRRKSDPVRSKYARNLDHSDSAGNRIDELATLGYSCANDGFAFNFTSNAAARKIISDFIAANVKTRRMWYTRDDSEGIAQSITHLMPPGTETSMAMPVFGFDGQVAFAIVAAWKDPLYTYPAGAMQFVETIAGSLLASVMKERLHQVERAQLTFAAAASHELRTPLHQLNAAATLLRSAIDDHLNSPLPANRELSSSSPTQNPLIHREDRAEALVQLEIIEGNGLALSNILENIIDTLDIGRLENRISQTQNSVQQQSSTSQTSLPNSSSNPDLVADPGVRVSIPNEENGGDRAYDFAKSLEKVVSDTVAQESQARRVAGRKGLEDVEIILEMTPRIRGGWTMTDDLGPLSRALGRIIQNSCKFTDKGYIHITVQDVSRDVVLPAGYDNSIKTSTVSIDIKDSGRGMSPDFLEKEVLRPFKKADPFMPGAGLGLGLAQRIVEILGGRLAIASTLTKGTLVHVEVPLHLLNDDCESDQEDLYTQGQGGVTTGEVPGVSARQVRQDGIYLAGFETREVGPRRMAKSLTRQLMLNFCRVVEQIRYASLIITPRDGISEISLMNLVKSARPGVQVIVLDKNPATAAGISDSSSMDTPNATPSAEKTEAIDFLHGIDILHLSRPLRPTLLARIMRPLDSPHNHPIEVYKSDVMGGDEARAENQPPPLTSGGSSRSIGSVEAETIRTSPKHESRLQVLPSPPMSPHGNSPVLDDVYPFPSSADQLLPPLRPPMGQPHPTEPLPTVAGGAGEEPHRPGLKEVNSTPAPLVRVSEELTRQLRVLVVEDNSVNRKILTTMLKRTDCEYAEAVDGQEAVNEFQSFQPDLILLDINMPVKDGFAAAAEIRQMEAKEGKGKRCRIIAVTAMSGEAQKRRGLLECGISEWRTKPVSIGELKAEVEKSKEMRE